MMVTRRRGGWFLVAALTSLLAVACASAAPTGPAPARPAPVRATPVELPAGATPQVLAASGDALLVGVRRDGAPGLLRRATDGAVTEIPTRASTPYGRTASWYALTRDGTQILGVGGDRGGAHGNVRWSVWTGTDAAVAEHTQAFTTFGGWGAGDLVGAVLTPAGPALIGSWQSDAAGLDVAVWTPNGDDWERHSSTGTALASTRTVQGFALAATRCADGALVAGWQVGAEGHAGQTPVVWRSTGTGSWVRTPLPDAGAAGVAAAASGDAAGCAVAGRVDGGLALWRLADGGWTRVRDVPPIPVGDRDPLPAPVQVGGRLVQLAPDHGAVTMLDVDGSGVTHRPVSGATGPVTAAVAVGSTVYVLAGDPVRLWAVDLPPAP
jgi:hypothetical protein